MGDLRKFKLSPGADIRDNIHWLGASHHIGTWAWLRSEQKPSRMSCHVTSSFDLCIDSSSLSCIMCLFSRSWFLGARKMAHFSGWDKEALGMHLSGSIANSLIGWFCGEGFELIPGDAKVTTSHFIKIRRLSEFCAMLYCSPVINKQPHYKWLASSPSPSVGPSAVIY